MTQQIESTATTQGCAACSKNSWHQQDFPIEWEGDHYVSRREMVKFLTLGSFLLAIANWVTAFGREAGSARLRSREAAGARKGSGTERPHALPLSHGGVALYRDPHSAGAARRLLAGVHASVVRGSL